VRTVFLAMTGAVAMLVGLAALLFLVQVGILPEHPPTWLWICVLVIGLGPTAVDIGRDIWRGK